MLVNSLTAFKRYLKTRGATCLTSYEYHGLPCGHKNLGVIRKPKIVQSNAVQFEGGSWLYFDTAKDWSFFSKDEKNFAVNDCGFCKLTYELVG